MSRVTLRVGTRILSGFGLELWLLFERGGGKGGAKRRDKRWARKGWVTVVLRAVVRFARGDSGLNLTSGFRNKLHEICPTVAVLQQPDPLSITWSRTSVLLSWRKGVVKVEFCMLCVTVCVCRKKYTRFAQSESSHL